MEISDKSRLRLHLGSGNAYWPGWINVDIEADCDVKADIVKLPFDNETVDEIQGIHVFEHLHRMEAPEALREWKRVLRKGGKLVLELPCLDKVIELFKRGEKNMRLTHFALYGDPNYRTDYMVHKWGWSISEITDELEANGFNVEVKEPVFHVKERDMRIEARRN